MHKIHYQRNHGVDRQPFSLLTSLRGIRIVVNLQRKSPEGILRQKQSLARYKHRDEPLKTLHQTNDEVDRLHSLVDLKSNQRKQLQKTSSQHNQQNPILIPGIQHRRSDEVDHRLFSHLTRVKSLRGRFLTMGRQKPGDVRAERGANPRLRKSLTRRSRSLNWMTEKPAQRLNSESEAVQPRGLFELSKIRKNLRSLSKSLNRNRNKLNLLGQMTHNLQSGQNRLHERNAPPVAKPSQ